MTHATLPPASSSQAADEPVTDVHQQNAVVLLSGGLDSVTCLYWAKARYASVIAVSFNYGQRHNSELVAAKAIAKTAKISHRIIDIDIAQLGGSSLTDHSMTIPDGATDTFPNQQHDEVDNDTIPNTYVPARNTIFLSYALAVAEVTDANHIVIGVSSVDYSGYPDCRPEYIAAFEQMANLATKAGVTGHHLSIQTPLQQLSKAKTIELGLSLGVDYAQTISCYRADANGLACGTCDSCALRRQGFAQAGVVDPTRYQA
ncbi:7-cyano-7-deazaguanine synthase QueC [Psychrobacter celer]|uniref:7-cyano-7-deazaguanine synthase QueC n=1 Tax=Psychrobacter sp. Rd 27.2 TaxID=1926479 RepID=UPI000946F072|nr:7-cyano-7-deazaguanine synthase QueC [Psychrobacter sp. Rd 27.2]MDN5732747.1 7-cyano-7-deazaguanine synthase QueC [Psychrobacter sp.]OLF41216.1 7-cyano-7-deazaguanine synthase QueC [Psychrobacter sp. Rd 27.2]